MAGSFTVALSSSVALDSFWSVWACHPGVSTHIPLFSFIHFFLLFSSLLFFVAWAISRSQFLFSHHSGFEVERNKAVTLQAYTHTHTKCTHRCLQSASLILHHLCSFVFLCLFPSFSLTVNISMYNLNVTKSSDLSLICKWSQTCLGVAWQSLAFNGNDIWWVFASILHSFLCSLLYIWKRL